MNAIQARNIYMAHEMDIHRLTKGGNTALTGTGETSILIPVLTTDIIWYQGR